MQEFLKQCGFVIISLLVIVIMRQVKAEMHIPVKLVIIVALFSVCVGIIGGVVSSIDELTSYAGVSKYASVMLKALFIGIITTVCSTLCADAGEGTLGFICTIIGKAQLLILALPLIFEILETAVKLIGGE